MNLSVFSQTPSLTGEQVKKFVSLLKEKKRLANCTLVKDTNISISYFNKKHWIYTYTQSNSGYHLPEQDIFGKRSREIFEGCRIIIGNDGIFICMKDDDIVSVIVALDFNGKFQLVKKITSGCVYDFCQWDESWTPTLGKYHTKGFNSSLCKKISSDPDQNDIESMIFFKNFILISIGQPVFTPEENKIWTQFMNIEDGKLRKLKGFMYMPTGLRKYEIEESFYNGSKDIISISITFYLNTGKIIVRKNNKEIFDKEKEDQIQRFLQTASVVK